MSELVSGYFEFTHSPTHEFTNSTIITVAMLEIGVIGAGELGGAIAHVLARRDVASVIRLIDESGRVAEGKALDIMQSSPVDSFATVVSGSTSLLAAAGAAVLVVADRAKEGEWLGEDGLALLKRIAQLGSQAVVIWASPGGREAVERGVRELKFSRARLFGSAPEGLAAAVRAVVAAETGGSAQDVALTVIGVPPRQSIVPWEDATIGGFLATRVLSEPVRRRLADKVAPLWPPGHYALAWAVAKAVDAIAGAGMPMISAFVAADDSNGLRMRAAALPVRLGPAGITRVELPSLNSRDRVALENAMLL
jgi:malate dehydrogenase